MHELAIAQALVEMASAEAARAGAARVTRVTCRIGALCQVEEAMLTLAFESARIGTPCANARVRVEKSPLRARCRTCERDFDVLSWDWNCPACGGDGLVQPGGDELELVSIDAEVGA
ncbi:MAG: hydrogenase maturation nickel metallochaperone HypA [Phycisphaerae bacterium]|jgi:hydrogenase nickel incorporation protein HypA/HybF